MAYKNLIDDTSTTVSADTPGKTLDLRNRTTLGRSSLGVPVRLKIYANAAGVGDTGVVLLLDSVGAPMLTVNLNNGAGWYVADGYLPATLAKYDLHYGGNLSNTLTVKDWSLYELADVSPNEGTLSASIGTFGLTATGTVA